MNKYFKKYQEKEVKLSEYNTDSKVDIEYLISVLGNITLPESIIERFIRMLHTYGGMYSVRRDKETILGLYDIVKKYPMLSENAIDEISCYYIKDLFDKYSLTDKIDIFIKMLGTNDDAFETYISYVKMKAIKLQGIYEEDAKKLDTYKGEYSDKYIDYLKNLVKREHVLTDYIIDNLPSKDIIKNDEEQLSDISKKARIYFGICLPISYSMTKSIIKGEDILKYPEIPSYYINDEEPGIPATFTREEFLSSIKKQKKLIK